MAVAAIGAGDDVIGVGRAGDADRDRLLAVGEMGAAADLALGEQLLDALLDRADLEHPPQLLDAVVRALPGARREPRN